MPKINVYLPDDLAEGVRAAGLPVSAICQRALEASVRRVAAIRRTALSAHEDPTAGLNQFTDRARTAIRTAAGRSRAAGGQLGTADLLHGVLDEGANLGVRVLRALGLDPAALAAALPQRPQDPVGAASFTATASAALELAVTEALALGHDFVGCEHLVLGLLAEPDGSAGALLRDRGADLRPARQAVVAALVGLTRAAPDPLHPVLARLDRLERHTGLAP
ncbi:Clp protease N-terminal domain-containing protein [Actinokineospora bangkokensis]|uniref:Clp protease N-terminal domain-containing protein n=1 Tax=Actinokineospora bangkokensis TaxID=1193682 RepID=UPI00096AE5B9|nr:Clp protease N-terminal domain-containing protein [Actinokineospora bangkokensis]